MYFRKLFRVLYKNYYKLKMSLCAINLRNRIGRKAYEKSPPHLSSKAEEIVSALEATGIFTCHVNEIFGDGFYSKFLKPESEIIINLPEIALQIESGKSAGFSGKSYVVRANPDMHELNLNDSNEQLCFSELILGVASNYFREFAKLQSMDYWINLESSSDSGPIASQLWHRDYEDVKLLKIFIYFNNVKKENGAFSYVDQTHWIGRYRHVFPCNYPEGVVITDEEIEKKWGSKGVRTYESAEGTIIFCDTSGIHKGGHCTKGRRYAFTATYSTPSTLGTKNYKASLAHLPNELSELQRYAIS